jgi:hypothetical protein
MFLRRNTVKEIDMDKPINLWIERRYGIHSRIPFLPSMKPGEINIDKNEPVFFCIDIYRFSHTIKGKGIKPRIHKGHARPFRF